MQKTENDFKTLEPYLDRVFDSVRKIAALKSEKLGKSPLDVLIKIDSFFIIDNFSLLIIFFVDLVKGQCNETKSDSLSNLFNVTGTAPASLII